jgi:hypothetical protein
MSGPLGRVISKQHSLSNSELDRFPVAFVRHVRPSHRSSRKTAKIETSSLRRLKNSFPEFIGFTRGFAEQSAKEPFVTKRQLVEAGRKFPRASDLTHQTPAGGRFSQQRSPANMRPPAPSIERKRPRPN